MNYKDSPIFIVLLLTFVGIIIPPVIFTLLPGKIVILYYTISINKETLFSYSLSLSYLMIFTYFLSFYIPTILVYFPSTIMFPKGNYKNTTEGRIFDICKEISADIGVKTPRLLLSEEPTVYSFGLNKDNATLVIYDKCETLDEQEIRAIVTHEMIHVKSNMAHHTLHSIFRKAHGIYSAFGLVALAVVGIFFYRQLSSALMYDSSLGLEGVSIWYNNIYPFAVAIMSVGVVRFLKNITDIFLVAFQSPSLEIEEFRADLITYISLKELKPIIRSIQFLRENQIKHILTVSEQRFTQKPLVDIKRIYDRIFKKGFYSKQYNTWLEYFTEDYSKLNFTLGRGFDFPHDKTRIEFLQFIDDIYKSYIGFRIIKELEIRYDIKEFFFSGKIAIVQWLKEVNDISIDKKETIITYLRNNSDRFNVKECSTLTGVELYETILVILYSLTYGSIELME